MSDVAHIGVITGPDGVLVGPDGTLPTFRTTREDAGMWQDTEPACRAFGDLVGVPVTVLRHLSVERIGEGSARVMLLDPHGLVDGPWRAPDRVDWALSGSLPSLLARRPECPEELRVPWFAPGWYRDASSWIESTVAAEGARLRELSQIRSWNLSTVIAAQTSRGRWFFKAESPALPGEALLTSMVSERHPDLVPRVVAVDAERRWMLLTDGGTRRLDDDGDPHRWEEAGRRFARMQVDAASDAADLVALGMPLRDAASLIDDVAAMVEDEHWLTKGDYGLDADELDDLRRLAPQWCDAIARLGEMAVPLSLEHGDFHPGQVMFGDDGTMSVLDWSDVSVSVPLVSLDGFLAAVNEFTGRAQHDPPPPAAAAFRDAYASIWAAEMGAPVVDRALDLIRSARPAFAALPYWRLVRRMEQPWEMWNVLPFYLRGALTDQST